MSIKIVIIRIYLFVLIPSAAFFSSTIVASYLRDYLFVTEWISAMYPPGNCTTTASRSSVLYGGTRTSTPLAFALVSGVDVLVPPYKTDEREAVVVQFPGGYIAEIHSVTKR